MDLWKATGGEEFLERQFILYNKMAFGSDCTSGVSITYMEFSVLQQVLKVIQCVLMIRRVISHIQETDSERLRGCDASLACVFIVCIAQLGYSNSTEVQCLVSNRHSNAYNMPLYS